MQLPSYTIDAPEHTNILPTGMKTLKVRVSRFTDAINILAWQGQNGMPNGYVGPLNTHNTQILTTTTKTKTEHQNILEAKYGWLCYSVEYGSTGCLCAT